MRQSILAEVLEQLENDAQQMLIQNEASALVDDEAVAQSL